MRLPLGFVLVLMVTSALGVAYFIDLIDKVHVCEQTQD